MNTPKRGEIYLVDWSPGRESEQTGIRPALVIQNDIGNTLSPNVIVASITTAPNKPYPFLVHVTAKETGLKRDSAVDLGSIVTVGKIRLDNKCGQLSKEKMAEVDEAICATSALKTL